MHPPNTRYFRLYDSGEERPELLHQRIDDLCSVVQSLAQDLAVTREMLTRRGLWDEAEYRRLRTERMIGDHASAGPSPWTRFSVYPHTRDQDDFLREELNADEEDLREFRRRSEFVKKTT